MRCMLTPLQPCAQLALESFRIFTGFGLCSNCTLTWQACVSVCSCTLKEARWIASDHHLGTPSWPIKLGHLCMGLCCWRQRCYVWLRWVMPRARWVLYLAPGGSWEA